MASNLEQSPKEDSPSIITISSLPSGLIVFTATPKLVDQGRCNKLRKRSDFLKQSPRRIVNSKDIDDISGMMGNLGVARNKSTSKKTSEVGATAEDVESEGISTDDGVLFPAASRRPTINRPIRRARRTASRKHTVEPMNVAPPSGMFNNIFDKAATNPVCVTKVNQRDKDCLVPFQKSAGFWRVPFFASSGIDSQTIFGRTTNISTKHQCISSMQHYEHRSMEEIRFEDYLAGRKGPTSTSFYGPKFRPNIGAEVLSRRGLRVTIETKHQCISAMSEYEINSFEELRLEHYMPSTGWRDREKYSLPQRELRQLPISINSDVFIFLNDERVKGKVKYIGRLPDKPDSETHAGIELDHPLGDGNGCYKNIRLFRTAEQHAKIVPLDAALPGYLFNDDSPVKSKETEPEIKIPVSGTSTDESTADTKETNKCAVCWSNPVSMFFLPCGHVCCCQKCSKQMKNCPMCRKAITAKHKAYLS